jgi:hypothetical protein
MLAKVLTCLPYSDCLLKRQSVQDEMGDMCSKIQEESSGSPSKPRHEALWLCHLWVRQGLLSMAEYCNSAQQQDEILHVQTFVDLYDGT